MSLARLTRKVARPFDVNLHFDIPFDYRIIYLACRIMGGLNLAEWQKLPISLSELCINTTLRCGQSFR